MKFFVIIGLIFLNISSTYAWGNIPQWCPLKGFENENLCWKYIMWKVNNIKEITFQKWITPNYLDEWKFYITTYNYFFTINWFKKIYETILNKEGWLTLWEIKKNDIIIFDGRIFNYSNSKEEKRNEILEVNFYKEKTLTSNLVVNNTYGTYYKIICENNLISLENKNSSYDLIDNENNVIDKKQLRLNLQKEIKTCSHFNKLFWLEKDIKKKENISWFYKVIDFILNIFK
jgi:hypothetical protein